MPRLSGLEVARLARERNYEGSILILSGYSDFKYAQEAMRYDVKYYITKPVDEDELTAHLNKVREELEEKRNAPPPLNITVKRPATVFSAIF